MHSDQIAELHRELASIHQKLSNLHGEASVSPHYPSIHTANEAWIEAYHLAPSPNLRKRTKLFDCAQFSAMTYPNFPKEHVQLGADLIAWLFLFDDYFGEARWINDLSELRAMFISLVTFWNGGGKKPYQCPEFADAMMDIISRGMKFSPPGWSTAFILSLESYFEGCIEEYKIRQQGQIPEFQQYRAVRELSIGAYPVFDLIDSFVFGYSFNNHQAQDIQTFPNFHSSLISDGRQIAAHMCVWINDIYSFEKERLEQDVNNIIYVLGKGDEPFHLALALERTFEMHRNQYLELSSYLEHPRLSQIDKTQLAGLKNWVDGCFHWTSRSNRYKHAEESFLSSSF